MGHFGSFERAIKIAGGRISRCAPKAHANEPRKEKLGDSNDPSNYGPLLFWKIVREFYLASKVYFDMHNEDFVVTYFIFSKFKMFLYNLSSR